jgi:multidrug transporter EmrE-like cation transporter
MSMNLNAYALALFSVIVIAIGQSIFKYSALRLDFVPGESLVELIRRNFAPLAAVVGALSLYMISTVAWITALRTIPLSVAFMFNALAFAFIPIVSTIFFGEQLPRFLLPGLGAIAFGIYLITLK